MEQNQFFGGPFALRIFNPNTGLLPIHWLTRNCQKAKGLRGHRTGVGERGSRAGGNGQTGGFRLRPGPCWPP
jgi:hypothetical protein